MSNNVNPAAKNDKFLRLEEMSEAIDKSLANLETIILQQHKLVEVIENSKEADYFKDFIVETKQQIENLENQKVSLIDRKLKINCLIKSLTDENKSNIILQVFDAFGIFD